MALANGVMRSTGRSRRFWQWVLTHPHRSILEVNTAAALHRYLGLMPRQRLVTYPEVDLQDLPFADSSWDFVIHSDTLEHVADPVQALRECRRVIRRGGALIYTIPIVPGRATRRCGLDRPSYHGVPGVVEHLVVTEYGDDYWREPIEAGFERVEMIRFDVTEAIVCR
jgi:SAM-dependent methyltransferase